MKRKIFYLSACLFLAGVLTGCGQKITGAYDPEKFDAAEILREESEELHGSGFASGLCVSAENGEVNSEGVTAEAFALFDLNNKEILSQKNIYQKVYPASTTKIMTCLLALELCDPEELVTVPEESEIDISGSSMANLQVGDQIRMKDLLYGLMVPSGNDAAVAIAKHISGSVDEFARLMNKRAQELGATETNFVNPHGLPDDSHFTTVYDMYLIFNEAIKNYTFREISSTAEYTANVKGSDGNEREVTWTSGNGFYNKKYSLPENYEYIGGKTGHTNAAGFCLVLGEKDNKGREYISIIMNSPIYENLYGGMINLVEKSR